MDAVFKSMLEADDRSIMLIKKHHGNKIQESSSHKDYDIDDHHQVDSQHNLCRPAEGQKPRGQGGRDDDLT